MTNEATLKQLAQRANKVVIDRDVQGKVGLYMSSTAWAQGKLDLMVKTSIPEDLTCAEAKEYGWALYMLGKMGTDLTNERNHDLEDDEDYFRD